MRWFDATVSPADGELTRPTALLIGGGALLAGVCLGVAGLFSTSLLAMALGVMVLMIVIALRHDTFTAALIVGVAIMIDFYQLVGLPLRRPVVAVVLTTVVLVVIFLAQSQARPWIHVPHVWLWAILLFLAAIEIPHGILLTESGTYYLLTFVNALLMFVLGIQIARSYAHLRTLVALLSGLAALIAVHAILYELTGKFLLETNREAVYLVSVKNFQLPGSTIYRVGSFLQHPDWSGAFFAMTLFLPLGLFLESRSRAGKVLYGCETLLILLALFFTFTTASWASLFVGIVVFVVLAFLARPRGQAQGRKHAWQLWLIPGGIAAALVGIVAAFPDHVRLLAEHVTANNELSLRIGAWETGLRVVAAHPLTGVGMGITSYLQRAELYRVKLQILPLAHPHDSYIEVAAYAGIPVFIAFATLLGWGLWSCVRTYRRVEAPQKALLCGIVAALVTLSFNSIAINGWTIPPLLAIGWLLIGATVSPALFGSTQPPDRRQETPSSIEDELVHRPQPESFVGSARV